MIAVENKIINYLVDLFKSIVNGIIIRYDADNQANTEVFSVSGSFTDSELVKINALVQANSVVLFTNANGDSVSHDFSIEPSFDLFDSGYVLTVNDLTKLYENDSFDIRCNNSYITLNDVRTWMKSSSNSIHPFLQVFPRRFPFDKTKSSDRTYKTMELDLQLELDFGKIDSDEVGNTILEVMADIETIINNNNRMKQSDNSCLAIEMRMRDSQPYISTANDDLAGAFIDLEIDYRTLNNTPRVIG